MSDEKASRANEGDVYDCVIVGAGVAGLAAGRHLQQHGQRVLIVDKSRGVGGRMATRRSGEARFDHGAQYFTARGADFKSLVSEWEKKGVAAAWFGSGERWRWRGLSGMTAGPKDMSDGLSVRASCKVERLEELGGRWRLVSADGAAIEGRHLIFACPAPQSARLVEISALNIGAALQENLSSVRYEKCIAGLLTLAGPSGLPLPGYRRWEEAEPIAWMADNQLKGVSPVPAVTVHSGPRFADTYFDQPPAVIEAALLEAATPWLNSEVVGIEAHKWRFAKRVEGGMQPYLEWDDHRLWFCGDSFGQGEKVEGAFDSGMAAAAAILRRISEERAGYGR